MSAGSEKHGPDHAEMVLMYALGILTSNERPLAEAQISACVGCRRDMEALGPIVDSFTSAPIDLLRPSNPLWESLARRIAAECGAQPGPPEMPMRWVEPEYAEVAPGLSCKLLTLDSNKSLVTLLVRLAPGADYPPHQHAGTEELYLLHGELEVDGKKLCPGDYTRAEASSRDRRVWSETGCTCVLITSVRDVLG